LLKCFFQEFGCTYLTTLVHWLTDPGTIEFRRLTESNFYGVEVVD